METSTATRGKFLITTLGGMAALAGCAGSPTSLLPSLSDEALAAGASLAKMSSSQRQSLFRLNGLKLIQENGFIFYSNGLIAKAPAKRRPTAILPVQPVGGSGGSGDPTPPPDSDGETTVDAGGGVSGTYSSDSFQADYTSNSDNPYGYDGNSSDGALYTFSQTAANCAAGIAGATTAALAAAQYIVQNASQYATAIGNSAMTALNRYQGTGMGIAAAASFVGLVFATLSASEILGLLVAIGAGVTIGFTLYACLSAGS